MPSGRRKARPESKLNLVPIMDSVFILIFFLIMSADFLNIHEIPSDIPLVSEAPPPPNQKKPLALTLEILEKQLVLKAGIPARNLKVFTRNGELYPLEELHQFLVELKKENPEEKTIIFETIFDLTYGDLVEIMDSVRMFQDTDDSLYKKDPKTGTDIKEPELFSNIIFGNLMS